MKKNIINVAVTLFFLFALGAETSQAQTSSNQFKSYIPFQFNVGKQKLPAGEYLIERTNRLASMEILVGGLSKGGGTKAPQIEGTWLLTVTTPPAAGRPPFEVLISFASGGVFLASAESDQGTPPQQGAWAKTGANEYTATALAFGHGPNPGDLFTFKIKSLFQLVGENELEGLGEAAICDASGNNCQRFPGCSTLHATRVTVEPPSCP